MIGRQIVLTLVATLALVAVVLSAGLLPFNSTARALPTAGTDILNVTGSTSIVSILGAETIALTGTVTIERSDPRIEGGVEVVDTEIVAMDIKGTSVTGPITMVESATFVSSGEIRSLQPPPDDFPASSFFDVFIEVAVPASPSEPLILHNEEAFHLVPTSGGSEVPLTAWPPTGVTYQDEPEPCIPMLPVLPAEVCVTSLSIVLGEPISTLTPTPCPSGKVPADGGCGTPTATPTHTPTSTPTHTPTPCPTAKVPADNGCGTPTPTPTDTPTPCPTGKVPVGSGCGTPTPKPPDGDTDGDTIPNSSDPDDDNDGCTDLAELQPKSEAATGGARDPHDYWDFMDMWVNKGKDKVVNIIDVGALVQRFGAAGDPGGDPLDPPQALAGYHVSADRSSPIGANVWNAGPPDGTINIIEIGLVVVQFGHNCSESP